MPGIESGVCGMRETLPQAIMPMHPQGHRCAAAPGLPATVAFRWRSQRRSHSRACQRVHALALEASAGLNAVTWTPQMPSRPQRNIRSQLLPRNIRRMQSATAVMPMLDYSGMNTTELKRATQLL
ncbi:hypothetical protein [Xanthomonas arboricola]|uniref:hypothetical protein n=1 Tax=Xanthomonas arboricola TaxID=56448 RepID=UPI001188F712|nr:hypothetical protein [Xanthomonas arboricola]QDS15331.1 hypothetical protein FPL04_06540 [Xanthomonas arboricola]